MPGVSSKEMSSSASANGIPPTAGKTIIRVDMATSRGVVFFAFKTE
jgi:hypothetical protein